MRFLVEKPDPEKERRRAFGAAAYDVVWRIAGRQLKLEDVALVVARCRRVGRFALGK